MPGRKKNILKTIPLTIASNQPLVDDLESLVLSGEYGKSATEAAERLIAHGIHDLKKEGMLLLPKKVKRRS
jgi:hypothetical protein